MPDPMIHICDCLADWIDGKMPGVGGVRTVNIRSCEVVPLASLLGARGASGITLWRTVSLQSRFCPINPGNRPAVELLLHELVHVEQFRNHPVWFPIKYLALLVSRGYWNHPAEIEARDRTEHLIQLYVRENPCHIAAEMPEVMAEIIEIYGRAGR